MKHQVQRQPTNLLGDELPGELATYATSCLWIFHQCHTVCGKNEDGDIELIKSSRPSAGAVCNDYNLLHEDHDSTG